MYILNVNLIFLSVDIQKILKSYQQKLLLIMLSII